MEESEGSRAKAKSTEKQGPFLSFSGARWSDMARLGACVVFCRQVKRRARSVAGQNGASARFAHAL